MGSPGAVVGEVEAGGGKVGVQSRTNTEFSIFLRAGKGRGWGTGGPRTVVRRWAPWLGR